LTFVPIVLYVTLKSGLYRFGWRVRFLLSTHYSHYDVWMFTVNCWALMMVLIPKLPSVWIPIDVTDVSSIECVYLVWINSIFRNLMTTNFYHHYLLWLVFHGVSACVFSTASLGRGKAQQKIHL
jgi:hypothetical protein